MFKITMQLAVLGSTLWGPLPVCAAEITGTVLVDHKGLFNAAGGTHNHPISVTVIPAENQAVKSRPKQVKRIEIVDNRMNPSFLTVQVGDELEFINRDSVFHQVFSLSEDEAIAIQLAQAGSSEMDRTLVHLDSPGTKHFFCRIHNKSYARVDVVQSPYLRTIHAGQTFSFTGLEQGRWTLRVASPAAETQFVEARALTAPEPLRITLASHDGGAVEGRIRVQSGIEELYQK